MTEYYNSDEDSDGEIIIKKDIKVFQAPTPPPPPSPTPEPVDTSLVEKGLLGILGIIGGALFYLKGLKVI